MKDNANKKCLCVCLTNRFQVAVRLFSNRLQMTSKCGKNNNNKELKKVLMMTSSIVCPPIDHK